MAVMVDDAQFASLIETVRSLSSQVASLQEEVKSLRQGLAASKSEEVVQPVEDTPLSVAKATTRRKMLGKLAAGLIVGAGLVVTGFGSEPKEADARAIFAPKAYSNDIGGIIVSRATQLVSQPPDITANFGLIASGDAQLDLSKVPVFDCAIYARGTGYGVYATSDHQSGYGVYATNTAGAGFGSAYAISGVSTNGVGVYGQGGLQGAGVQAVASGNGPGLYVEAQNGGPAIRIVPSAAPAGGSPGDVYADSSGNLYVNNGTVWRKVAFAS